MPWINETEELMWLDYVMLIAFAYALVAVVVYM